MSENENVVTFPNAPTTAEEVLRRTLKKAERIKAVAVVIQWDDHSFSVDWSNMKMSELCMASVMLDDITRDEVRQRKTDGP